MATEAKRGRSAGACRGTRRGAAPDRPNSERAWTTNCV